MMAVLLCKWPMKVAHGHLKYIWEVSVVVVSHLVNATSIYNLDDEQVHLGESIAPVPKFKGPLLYISFLG